MVRFLDDDERRNRRMFLNMGGIVDLVVWREAASLAVNVENAARTLRGPGAAKLADQMIRAANSIQANIAEGYGRGVSQDGIRLFTIAHASADELEAHTRVLGLNRRLKQETVEALIDQTRRTGYLIHRYRLSIQRRLPH